MKNFSTVGVRFVIAALFSGGIAASAQAANCAFLANAPDQHLVVKGDTLWGISGQFLEHPWCWGQVWGMNREEIRNPHWIFPGQIVYFDRVAGRLRLGKKVGDGSASGVTRLSPQLRTEGLGKDAVPAIASGAIEPFLSQPLVIEVDELNKGPRIVAAEEAHVMVGKDDKAYVRGDLKGGTSFQVYRPGKELKDPVSKAVIGYEAFYLGTVKLKAEAKPGTDVHTFTIASAKEEIGVGDYLIPSPPTPMQNYVPHPPETQVDARVMSVYGGVTYAGQNQIVSINRGSLDGLDIGSVLQLYHLGQTVVDKTVEGTGLMHMRKPTIKLPDEEIGSVFVFRVFKHVSYGLIMQVTEPVQVGDIAVSPE